MMEWALSWTEERAALKTNDWSARLPLCPMISSRGLCWMCSAKVYSPSSFSVLCCRPHGSFLSFDVLIPLISSQETVLRAWETLGSFPLLLIKLNALKGNLIFLTGEFQV